MILTLLFCFLSSVCLCLPKFSISADASLDVTLKELGITDAFEDTADFSRISEDIKLKLSKVRIQTCLHICFVNSKV